MGIAKTSARGVQATVVETARADALLIVKTHAVTVALDAAVVALTAVPGRATVGVLVRRRRKYG